MQWNFFHVKNWLDQMGHPAQYISGQYPGRPVFIVGHSLGGLMAVLALISMPDVFRGAVLIAPSLQIDPEAATPIR